VKKHPAAPEEIFQEYVADWQAGFGQELESIILYGSGARGEFVAGKSDINFLVILTPAGMAGLRRAVEITEKWRKLSVAVPLVLTREYMQTSLDSFPIEFLNIKRQYRLVFGEDVLRNLEISSPNLRLQLEREMKGKLLHLREGLLNQGFDREGLRNLLLSTIPIFAALFEAFLFLKNEKIPATKQEIFIEVARSANLNAGFIGSLFRLQKQESRWYREELWKLMEDYIAQIEKLTVYVDRLSS
jgi:predicted nucleotidyltransferase